MRSSIAAWLEPTIGVCTVLAVVSAVVIAHISESQEHAMNEPPKKDQHEPDGLTDKQRNGLDFTKWRLAKEIALTQHKYEMILCRPEGR